MQGVHIEVLKVVDTSFPGWAECRLVDTAGTEWRFVEKLPVVLDTHADHVQFLPRPGVLGCVVLSRDDGGVTTIETGTQSTTGQCVFQVHATQLFGFDG